MCVSHSCTLSDVIDPWNDPLLPAMQNYTRSGYIFSKLIHGYLISHAHFDHNIGLILDSVSDVSGAGKFILGNHQTVTYLRLVCARW
jgi:cAMP phosphodiesterase